MKKNKSKINKKFFKGFTLVETLVAVFVFSLAITMLAGTFSSFLKNYAEAKKAKKNVENAQYAMNLMAKTIRTSFIDSVSAGFLNLDSASGTYKPLDVYDYSQGKCIRYRISNHILQSATGDSNTPGDPATCQFSNLPPFVNLTDDIIESNSVSAVPTNASVNPILKGRVVVSLEIRDAAQASDSFPIQMTVSLRQ